MVKRIPGSAGADTLFGTNNADIISAGAGMDIIYGFMGLDSIDGGAGLDALFISGTALDLNNATDAQLTSVEAISAKIANGGVTINLRLQSEGFALTGSSFNDLLQGGRGADLITAGDGDDIVYGFDPNDTVNGGGGIDTIITTTDIIPGADAQLSGIENINASTAASAIIMNLGKQSEKFLVIGSAFDDEITGGSAADVINSGAGDDRIHGFIGNDFVNGGSGVDTLFLRSTSAFLNAAMDYQLVDIEIINATNGSSGIMVDLSRHPEAFTIIGSSYSDTLKGGQGSDSFFGSSGTDFIDGGSGDDALFLTGDLSNVTNAQLTNVESVSAADALRGVTINLGAQNERFMVTGSAFGDFITGGVGAELINAGGGDDIIVGFASPDTLDGGAGYDKLILLASSSNLNSATDNQLRNVEAISAATAINGVNINLGNQTENFMIAGSSSSDTLKGGIGDDSFLSFFGTDFIDGGQGNDTLIINNKINNLNGASDSQILNVEAISALEATTGVTLILNNQTEAFTITGGRFGDVLTATPQSDTYLGFIGDDTVNGGGGIDVIVLTATSADLNKATNMQISNIELVSATAATEAIKIDLSQQLETFEIVGSAFGDTLSGGAGADKLTGGAGADHLHFAKMPANKAVDVILDFTAGVDRLDFTKSAFNALGAPGGLTEPLLWASANATSAHDADDRIIYNTITGALYYDADGVGGTASIQIATLAYKPVLLFSDIFVI